MEAAVNSAFVGDDGKVMVIDVLSSPSVKHEIDYSAATKRPQIVAALAGKNKYSVSGFDYLLLM